MHKAGYTITIGAFAAAAAFTFGAAGLAGASTDTTVPAEPAHTGPDHTAAEVPTPTAGEPTSPEAEAFCAAEVAVEAAAATEDPAVLGPAVEAILAVTPAELLPAVEIATNPELFDSPEFGPAYGEVIDWMKANCGYAQVDVSASEFAFEGLPSELQAGGTIFSLENVGEQAHETFVIKLNDDVTLSAEEIQALPPPEVMALGTPAAFAFAFPGEFGYATAELAPGNYVTVCLLFDGATPEVLGQLAELGVDGPEDTIPADAGIEIGPPHFSQGMVHLFTVA